MAQPELAARLTADVSGFADGMQNAVAIAQATATSMAEAFATVAGDHNLQAISAVAAAGAASAKTGLDEMGKAATAASRETADSVASAFAPLTDAGARMFGAWIKGGRDMQREFASIVQSMISDLAKSGLQDLIFGAKSGSPVAGIFGKRGEGGGLYGAAARALDSGAIQKALASAWQGVSGTISNVLRGSFQSIAGSLSSLFGSSLSSAAGNAVGISAGGGASALTGAASAAAQASALTANTAALGVLTAAIAADTLAEEQLVLATEFDAATHMLGFAGGGVVPSAARGMVLGGRGTLAILHPREMVLPAHLSDGIQSAIAGGRLGDQSGGDVHVHIGSIHGGNAIDMRRELDRFADRIGDIVREQHRANRFLKSRY
jgi:hypothetical protein